MAPSSKVIAEGALARLSSPIRSEHAAACHTIADLFVNATSTRYLELARVFLPALLRRAAAEPGVMVPLATAAHCLWGSQAYAEALSCLDATLPHAAQEALSEMPPPWVDKTIPLTREREMALQQLWRIECLFALERAEDARALEAAAVALATSCLPPQFGLTLSDFYELGSASDFLLCARIRAARALRLRAGGRDAHASRRPRKSPKAPDAAEANRLRGLARCLVDEFMPELDRFLPELARHDPKDGVVTLEDQRRIGKWRGQGYAEAGLLARDAGDLDEARRLLAIAHWVFASVETCLDIGVGPEYMDPIRALAPLPGLPPTPAD